MRALAILVLVLVAIGGCASSSSPESLAVATGSSSPVAPTAPVDFLAHLAGAEQDGQTRIDAVNKAYASGGLPRAQPQAQSYVGWADAELAWLTAHPPVACVDKLQAAWTSAVTTFRSAMSSIALGGQGDPTAVGFLEGTQAMLPVSDLRASAKCR